jgi:hypothetical protein
VFRPAAPRSQVVSPGEFVFAVAFLEHDHRYGQCAGLLAAGATLKWVFDPDLEKMRAGKDYFTDKAPLTTAEQLCQARQTAAESGRKFAVYFRERFHNEAALHATDLVANGAIGKSSR